MSPRSLAVGGTLLASLAAPAAAEAVPTLQPLKPCYVTAATPAGQQREPVQIAASGFTPNSTVGLAIDGAVVPGGQALQTDAAGALVLPADAVPAPFIPRGSRPFTVTLTEAGNPANTVSAASKTSALRVTVRPETAKPSHKVRFKGLGFTQDKPVYAHYVRKGKLRKTVRMARRPGECGSFEVRRRQIPIRKPRLGRWIVQFDQSREYLEPAVQPVFVRLVIKLELQRP